MIFQLGIPMIRYLLHPIRENLKKAIRSIVEDNDPIMLEMVKLCFDHVKIESNMPRPVKKSEIANFNSPTMIITAENDIICPGKAILKKAKKIIPNLIKSECYPKTVHAFYTAPGKQAYTIEQIKNFLIETKYI